MSEKDKDRDRGNLVLPEIKNAETMAELQYRVRQDIEGQVSLIPTYFKRINQLLAEGDELTAQADYEWLRGICGNTAVREAASRHPDFTKWQEEFESLRVRFGIPMDKC